MKSVRANLLDGGIEVTCLRLVVINSAFFGGWRNIDTNETIPSFHGRFAIHAPREKISCGDDGVGDWRTVEQSLMGSVEVVAKIRGGFGRGDISATKSR